MLDQKKRILMVSCGGLGKGGVQAIMMGIVRSLSNKYLFDMLVFTNEKRYYDDEFLKYGGRIFRIPHYCGNSSLLRKIDVLLRDIYTSILFCKLLLSNKYDCIHCNNQTESAPLLVLSYLFSIPIRICHAHVVEDWSNKLLSPIKKMRVACIKKFATHLIGCSEEACVSLYGTSSDSFVVNNFYDDVQFKTNDSEVMPPHFVLTQVGAFSDNKNQLFTVRVFHKLQKIICDAELFLVGFDLESQYRQKVLALADTLGVSSKISVFPGDADIPRILKESSYYIMPSRKEGFGISIIEAQALNLKCLASDTITRNTNCGSVRYLSLNEPVEKWVDCILDHLEESPAVIDTTRFKQSIVIKKYDQIYDAE